MIEETFSNDTPSLEMRGPGAQNEEPESLNLTAGDLIRAACTAFSKARPDMERPKQHAERVIRDVLGWSPSDWVQNRDKRLSLRTVHLVRRCVERRIAGEPLQYIVGKAGFWDDEFQVGPGVLIPRPETELIVEYISQGWGARDSVRVAELGPGSGCIPISVLKRKPNWEWIAIESNPLTIPYLIDNSHRILGADNRCLRIVEGDFFERLPTLGKFDIVVSNPPYVPTKQVGALARELQFEPLQALDGGVDGLSVIRRLIPAASQALNPSGQLIFEMDPEQSETGQALLGCHGFHDIRVHLDLNGRARLLSAELGTAR